MISDQPHDQPLDRSIAVERLAHVLADQWHVYTQVPIERDVHLPEVDGNADILFTFPMGWRVVHQVQDKPLKPTELDAHTVSFYRAGIDVVWWLAYPATTLENRTWYFRKFGASYIIECRDDELQLWRWGQDAKQDWWLPLLPLDTPVHGLTLLLDHWKRTALLRYFELWGDVNNAKFLRALMGTDHLRLALNGLIGGLNIQKQVLKHPSGTWYPRDLVRIYPEIPRWPTEGLDTARTIAEKLQRGELVRKPDPKLWRPTEYEW